MILQIVDARKSLAKWFEEMWENVGINVLLRGNGMMEPSNITIADVETPDDIRKLIGCELLEILETENGNILVIDEEGKLKCETKLNFSATVLYKYAWNAKGEQVDFIVGNAVWLSRESADKIFNNDEY